MKYYYYAENNQQFGPFTIEELNTLRLKQSTLVWCEGMEEWLTADSIDELKEILISEPPPLPKTNKAQQTFETVEIKQIPESKTSKRFDLTYKKEGEAVLVGIMLTIVPTILSLTGTITFDSIESYSHSRAIIAIISFVLRIAIAVWVVNIATRQNRNSTGWGWFAFIFPSIALIVIGLSKKLRLKIELDESLSKDEQVKYLFEKADYFYSKNRNLECIKILDKIIEIDSENKDCVELYKLANDRMSIADKDLIDEDLIIKRMEFEMKYHIRRE
jgi:hypothetical protein